MTWAREMECRIALARRGVAWQDIARRRGVRTHSAIWKSVRRWLDAEEWEDLCRARRAAGGQAHRRGGKE